MAGYPNLLCNRAFEEKEIFDDTYKGDFIDLG